ncbi:MAG: hypothetical protein AB7E81_06705 [Hyphomicrobiaceae bacterium]
MRTIVAALAFSLTLLPALQASAQDRRYSRKSYDRDRYEQRQRTSTMDREGRCIRDNGRSMNSLNLRNQCDREEFWARFNDFGDGRN